MFNLAVPAIVFEMTESNALLGTAALAMNLPAIAGSPLGGVWADRYAKRWVLFAALVAQAGFGLLLYRVTATGALTLPLLLLLATAIGFAVSVNLSAYQALVADIVPVHQLRPAYKLNAIQFNLARAVGPAIAGLVLARWGATTTFLVASIAHLPLMIVLLLVRVRRRPPPPRQNMLREIWAAARITAATRPLWIALLAVSVTAAFGMSIQQLAKGLADQVYGVDDAGFGLMVSAIGAASVATAIATAIVGDRLRGSVQVRIGLVAYGLGLFVVAATDDFELALVGFAITGFAHVLVNVSVTTAIQAHVSDAFRGRVTSLQLMAIILAVAFGAQTGGVLGDVVGLPAVVGGWGALLLVFAVVSQWGLDGLRALD